MRTAMICFGMLLLAACQTPAEQAAYNQAQMDRMIAVYGPGCSRLGYQADTDPWRNCVLQWGTREELARSGYLQSDPWPWRWRR